MSFLFLSLHIYVESIIESQGVTILNRNNHVNHVNSETESITFKFIFRFKYPLSNLQNKMSIFFSFF